MSVQTGIGVRGAEAQAGEQRGRVTIVRPPGSLGKGVRGDCVPAASAPPSIRVPLGQEPRVARGPSKSVLCGVPTSDPGLRPWDRGNGFKTELQLSSPLGPGCV